MRLALLILAGLALTACSPSASTDDKDGSAAPVLTPWSEPVIHEYVAGSHSIVNGLDAEDVDDTVTTHADLCDSTRVWADGRFDCVRDGQFREGRVDPTKVDALLQRLRVEGAFGDGSARYASFGPDSPYNVIEVKLADRTLHLASWHEGAEQSPGLVGTDRGIESLGAHDKAAVLAATPPEYQRFRRTWADIRSSIDSWIPPSVTPTTR